MMPMTVGLWRHARTGLVAVPVESEGRRVHSPLHITRTDEGYCQFLAHLQQHVGLDVDLVLTVDLVRSDNLANLAGANGLSHWAVPTPLVAAIRTLLPTGPPHRMAAAIARLPLTPVLRLHLRRVPPKDTRQLSLL